MKIEILSLLWNPVFVLFLFRALNMGIINFKSFFIFFFFFSSLATATVATSTAVTEGFISNEMPLVMCWDILS